MNPVLARRISALWLLAGSVMPLAAQKWQVQYFYDQAKSTFAIADLQFPSATRGIAVGVIREGRHEQPMSVVTSDGGTHWQQIPLKETPSSLFFLNDSQGWMVTNKGLWQTSEAGRSWTRLPKVPAAIFRVYFLNETVGWAIGAKKVALATQDGGKTWKPLDVGKPQTGENVNFSAFTWITFATPKVGIITGWNNPPRRFAPALPDWVDPESAVRQRQTPHLSYTVQTSNGGASWTSAAASLFGVVARVRLQPNGTGIGLTQFNEGFRYPSEAYTIQWPPGSTRTVYRDPKFNVTDVWLTLDGTAYLAGIQMIGQMRALIPSKVQVLTSKDMNNWTPMAVDYRAQATGVVLAVADDDHLWMATDTGMILKLVK